MMFCGGVVMPRSEAGAQPRPAPGRPTQKRAVQMTGSTALHTESRPSMLSSERIAITQHSGAAA